MVIVKNLTGLRNMNEGESTTVIHEDRGENFETFSHPVIELFLHARPKVNILASWLYKEPKNKPYYRKFDKKGYRK